MARIYKTELDKDTFFSKLENYRKKEALAKPIKGWLENEKGLLKEGGRYGTKFSVRFVDEKQIKVNANINLGEIDCGFAAALIFMTIVKIGTAASLLFFLPIGLFCGSMSRIKTLAWKNIEKVLKEDFGAERIIGEKEQG